MRLSVAHHHGGKRRRIQLYFRNDGMALARAKKEWAGILADWRGRAVSEEEWKEALATLRTYCPKRMSHSDMAKVRWGSDVPAVSQRANDHDPLGGNVYLVTVCRHIGLDLNIENGIGDITLCHMLCRRMATPGDLVVGITAAPRTGPAKSVGIGSRWPPAYHAAIQEKPDDRRIVWMALVDEVLPEAVYHGSTPHGCRKTVVYKKGHAGKLTLRIKRKYENVPLPGRNGPTLVSTSFSRYPADLMYAPFLPKDHLEMLTTINFGRDRVCPPMHAQWYRDLFLSVHGCF